MKLVDKAVQFYQRYSRFVPVAAFFGGFTWDSLTLTRIDLMFDNLILLLYILCIGGLILIVTLVENGRLGRPWLLKYRDWYPVAMQFFLGGLFSAYVIFYVQSASLTKNALFVLVLFLLLVANEFLEKRLTNLYLLLALYFVAAFSFFIFFIPVVTKVMNLFTFIAAGLSSLLLVGGLLYILHRWGLFMTRKALLLAAAPPVVLYLVVNLFYWQNWIPPVPLSLKDRGIYHHAHKDPESDLFVLQYERPKWYQFWKTDDDPFHYAPGDSVNCFTAVFAPTMLTKGIVHHWQKYLPSREAWVTTDRLQFPITGYREGGYRGITRKVNVSPGDWRVNVETEDGLLLGRIDFEVVEVPERVELKTVYR